MMEGVKWWTRLNGLEKIFDDPGGKLYCHKVQIIIDTLR
jgi:hypothetical protein